MNGNKRTWIVMILLILVAGPAAAYYTFREDPQISKVKDLFQQSRADGLSRDERNKIRQEIGETMEAMGPEKVVQMEMQSGRNWEERGKEEMDKFFAMPVKERKLAMEKMIREDEKKRIEREKQDKERQAKREKAAKENGTTLAQSGGQGGGRGGFGRGSGNDSARAQAARLRLDSGDPDNRAKRSEMKREFQQKRMQMGLQPDRPRGGGRGPR